VISSETKVKTLKMFFSLWIMYLYRNNLRALFASRLNFEFLLLLFLAIHILVWCFDSARNFLRRFINIKNIKIAKRQKALERGCYRRAFQHSNLWAVIYLDIPLWVLGTTINVFAFVKELEARLAHDMGCSLSRTFHQLW